MDQSQQPTPRSTLIAGLVFFVSGIVPMLAAFDIGPLRQADIHGPPWLGFASGGVFSAAGLALMTGRRWPLASQFCVVLALAGLAGIGSWVAFGAGERVCSGSISLPGLDTDGDWSGLRCRIPFGLGALVTDAFLCYMIVATLQKAMGGPPRLARLLKAAEWLLIASIAPFILLLAMLVIGSAAAGALKTRLTTGAWPRNEAFIARQKAKGLLGRLGRKPPDAP